MSGFTVPDEDMMDTTEYEREYSEMEVDGDSFQEQIDGKTRVQNEQDERARQQQQQQQQQKQQRAPFAYVVADFPRVPSPPRPQFIDPNTPTDTYRPARPTSRPNVRFTSPTHDQHMLNGHVPSSTGKRKRDQSQPPARDTYNPEPATVYAPAVRRVSAVIITTMYAATISVLSSAWNFVTGWANAAPAPQMQEAEIAAIETDTSGRKRRAVPSGSFPESPRSQGTNSATSSPAGEPTTPSRSAPGAYPSNIQSSPQGSATSSPSATEPIITLDNAQGAAPNATQPWPQGSTSPPSRAKKPVEKTYDAPGAFPTPEMSESPPSEQPKPYAHPMYTRTKTPRKEYTKPVDTNPALMYDNVSIYPTLAEMEEYAKGLDRAVSLKDWVDFGEEKKRRLAIKDLELLKEWAAREDARQFQAEEQFWEKEHRLRETARMKALHTALATKFGKEWVEQELQFHEACHVAFHTLGKCDQSELEYVFHEVDGLRAHEEAKIFAQEVAEMSPEEKQAFKKTSANKKFSMRTPRSSGSPPAQQGKQRKSVAPATKKGKGGKKAGTTKDEKEGATKKDDSRPTTSSSHKPASYKGGLAPTPKKDDPGADHQQAWSYDPSMPPGPSLLKPRSHHEQKDKKIEDLVERSRKLRVESPQEARFRDFIAQRRARSRERWEKEDAIRANNKFTVRKDAEEGRKKAEKAIQDAQMEWDRLKQAQEEEAARFAATKLAEEKAIEEERARKAAEEAAKLRAEKEAEDARKAEEAEKAAAAEAAHATKQILIRPLDPEWAERVQKAMDLRDKDAVLATAMDGTSLRRHDFGSLLPQEGTADDPSGWLNDEIINAFITAIVTRKQEQTGYKRGANSTPPFASFNSAWWTSYKTGGVKSIGRWSRRKGIQGAKLLKAEKLFFPINGGAHWQLLIISPQERNIEFLDSLRGKPTRHFQAAREWLEMELGKEYVPAEWTETHGRSNRQGNVNDCGVFVAMNSLAAGKRYPFSDVSMPRMPDARKMIAAVLLNGGLRGDWDL